MKADIEFKVSVNNREEIPFRQIEEDIKYLENLPFSVPSMEEGARIRKIVVSRQYGEKLISYSVDDGIIDDTGAFGSFNFKEYTNKFNQKPVLKSPLK